MNTLNRVYLERPTDKDAAIAYIPTTKLKIMEIWKDIEGYPNYQISTMGRVKSLGNNKTRKDKILKSYKNNKGYLVVHLYKEGKVKGYSIHRLVTSAFIPNPNNLPQVNHKDEDKTNNRVDNLEWCDNDYNRNYGTRTERVFYKLSKPVLQFTKDGKLVKIWENATHIKNELGFSSSSINSCCNGKIKTAHGYKWCFHYKSLWERKHIPLIKQKKVA